METIRIVSLTRRKHRYVFRYPEGEARAVLDAAAIMAADPTCPFDYFDAMGLAYWMGRILEARPRSSSDNIAACR